MTSDDDALSRPILIVGSPRSGTTSISRILGLHPDCVLIGEPRFTWQWGNEGRSDRLRPEHATPAVRRHIRGSFAALARAEGASRIVEKYPGNSIRMGFVEAVFPDGLFVHTIRDPRDAVISILDYWQNFSRGLPRQQILQRIRQVQWRQLPMYARELLRRTLPASVSGVAGGPVWGPRLPGLDALRNDLDLIDVCCLQWRACVEAAAQYGRRLGPERYFEYRLEDWDETTLEALLEFVDLRSTDEVWSEFKRQRELWGSGSRQATADPATLRRIVEWTEPTMRWLGYDPEA